MQWRYGPLTEKALASPWLWEGAKLDLTKSAKAATLMKGVVKDNKITKDSPETKVKFNVDELVAMGLEWRDQAATEVNAILDKRHAEEQAAAELNAILDECHASSGGSKVDGP